MKKIEIMGRKFELCNADEVTLGAYKEVEKAKFAASLALISNEDAAEYARGDAKKEGVTNEKEFMERIISGDFKNALIDSQDAVVTHDEEVIMLSANLTREELMDLPYKLIEKLAIEADKAIGGLANFTNASPTNST
jgi:hypothetical protein